MLLYQDILTEDEMFSDAYDPCVLLVLLAVKCFDIQQEGGGRRRL